jgi:ADP-ribose diphosphatase
MREKKVKQEQLYKGTLLGLRRDTVEFENGKQSTREIVEHPGAVAVVAITKDNELVLVKQFRTPTGQVLLEIPAGVPHKGEKAEVCAQRELKEETGYYAKKVKKIWEGYASPGYSDEVIQFCLATDLTLMAPDRDEDEFIEVDLLDLEGASDMLRAGKILDNKTMVGIHIAELYKNGQIS